MKILKESRDISKGIFWVVWDIDGDINSGKIMALSIPCDRDGNPTIELPTGWGNSKKGNNNTHKKSWKFLVSDATRGIRNHAWNYFPRGRLEIDNNTAVIYVNSNISQDNYQNKILKEFGINGSGMQVKWVVDGSDHYDCHLDNDNIK